MTIKEKAKEYSKKCFSSNDMSNSSNKDIATQAYIEGANWMLEKVFNWLKEHADDMRFLLKSELE